MTITSQSSRKTGSIKHFLTVQRNSKGQSLKDANGDFIYEEHQRHLAENIAPLTDSEMKRSKNVFVSLLFVALCLVSLIVGSISLKAGIGLFVIGSFLFFSTTLAIVAFIAGILFLI